MNSCRGDDSIFDSQENIIEAYQEGRREEVFYEPKLDAALGIAQNTENHDRNKSLGYTRHVIVFLTPRKPAVPRRANQRQR